MLLKRSEIERSVETAIQVFQHFGFHLPPFAFWNVEDWQKKGPEADEIRDCMLGWDVTDFGSGRFKEIGRTLLTLRNGSAKNANYPKTYAEKLILDPENQRAPAHFHLSKREDIINRGGGNILVEVCKAMDDGKRSDEPFTLQVDGQTVALNPGDRVCLESGQSVCLPARTIHQFWGEEGTGLEVDGVQYTVSGEVSSVCDDLADNFFLEPMTRFPELDEDVARTRYLCGEYPAAPG